MEVILTYDVDGPHDTPVKNALMSAPYNYKDEIKGVKISDRTISAVVKLPNTTLYHSNKTKATAGADIIAVTKACRATLEKYIAFEISGWQGNDPA